ncbi:MAG TPA: DUF6798 domain-containing protein [Candidatus Acidoferrum sp.]|nr:DUF6798 domain-containing protein [Candidatus Acidoferrum sp.]
MPARSGSAAAVALVAVGWAVYVGRFWLAPPPPVTSADDGVLYVAAALHLREPALFAGDWGFQTLAPLIEPLVYTRILARLSPWWDTPEALLRTLSALLILVFALGTFALVRALTGGVVVALLAGLIALRPRMAWLTEWGILMGQPLARSVIMAAAPWLLLWIWRARERPSRLAWPGLAIGLCALVHPLSAIQLAMVALLQELFLRSGVRAIVALAAGIGLGVLPAFAHHGSLLADYPAPAWFLRFRNPELLPSGLPAFLGPLVFDFGVPVLALALTLRASRACLDPQAFRWSVAGIAAALTLTMATLVASLAPALARFSLGRASGFLYLFLSVPVLAVARAVWTAGGTPRLAALALVGALALSTGAGWDALLGRGLAGAGIRLGERASWNPSQPPDPLPSLPFVPHEPRAFREMADWVRAETPPTALLLAAPADAAALRVYARRGTVVATKDAGLFIFSADRATAWYARFRDVVAAYAGAEPDSLLAAARRYGATHVLAGPSVPRLPLAEVFANRAYVVYRVGAAP